MQKSMMFMKRKDGLSFDEFRDHYENVHIPMVAKWVGHLITDFKRYYPQNAVNLYVGRQDADKAPKNDGGLDYDAVSIYSIRDEAALQELLRIAEDPEFARVTTEDEAHFADRALSRQTLTDEITGPGLI